MAKVAIVVMVLAALLGLYRLWPKSYYANDLKYVEYNSGMTCSYMPFDRWNQFPLICGSTQVVLETEKYR